MTHIIYFSSHYQNGYFANINIRYGFIGADKRGTNSPETEGSAPWMPSGSSAGHRSSSARDSWTPGGDTMCICHFGAHKIVV